MKVSGSIRPPGDKSITHRALIVSALIADRTRLEGLLAADDAQSTARVLRALGAAIDPLDGERALVVQGGPWHAPGLPLDCGNSGTTARLMLGALAGHGFTSVITGDESLSQRPMQRVIEPLEQMGAVFNREHGDRLPLAIRGGTLRPIEYTSPVSSAQVKSAILLAALCAGVDVVVVEPIRSRDHTERMFKYLGLDVVIDGRTIRFRGSKVVRSDLTGFELSVPADPSSAAFLIAAALLADSGELQVRDVCANPTRTGYLRVMWRMGADIKETNKRVRCGEDIADLLVVPGGLRGTEIHADEIPALIDEIPVLAVLASRAVGETIFRSVGELRIKEADRLALTVQNLRAIGADATVAGDDLVVWGAERSLQGKVHTAGDHRMAMAFAVLNTAPHVSLELSERQSPVISYPRFFDDLRSIGLHG